MKIYVKDYQHIKEVDSKILELAKELDAKVATTDFNLSKVAVLQGIPILNVNDLAAALKSVVLPGDNIQLYLAKEGKEKSQAVGYLRRREPWSSSTKGAVRSASASPFT